MIGPERIGHGFADVDGDRHQIGLIALIHVRHSDLQGLGVAVRVPAGGDVVPGVQCRHNRQSHSHDYGDHIAGGLAHVTYEYFPDKLHRAPPCPGCPD